MVVHKRFFSLLLGSLLLAPAAAFADHDDGPARRSRWSPPLAEVHVHSGSCGHDGPPAPPPQRSGRYELRPVQRWVEGYNQQVWVPEHCVYKHRRHRMRCTGGYYENRWVPGYNETVQEWVWVPNVYAPHGGVRVSLNF